MKELIKRKDNEDENLVVVLDGYELPPNFYDEAKKLPTDESIVEKFRKCVIDL